ADDRRFPAPTSPPATRTFPLLNVTAACCTRCVDIGSTAANALAPSKTSALASELPLDEPYPPAKRIFPAPKSDAVCHPRATLIVPVAVNEPDVGSKISATEVPLRAPPATRTAPEGSVVVVWCARVVVIAPVDLKAFTPSKISAVE